MKKNLFVIIVFVLSGGALLTSLQCKKSCMAGSGGDVTLVLTPQHHSKSVLSTVAHPDSAFVKFNVTDFPGTNPASYNMVLTAQPGSNSINASGLKCGQYYIYMTGFDTTINLRVSGGIPFNFSQTSGQTTVLIPVTE